MKKPTLLLAALLALSVNALAQPADGNGSGNVVVKAKGVTLANPKPEEIPAFAELTKERDEARAQLTAAQNDLKAAQIAAQQDALAREYFKAVAEKNQTLLELVAARQQIDALQRQTIDLQAKLAEAVKPITEPKKK